MIPKPRSTLAVVALALTLLQFCGCSIIGHPEIGLTGHATTWEMPKNYVIYDRVYEDYYMERFGLHGWEGCWTKDMHSAKRFTKKDALAFCLDHKTNERGEYSNSEKDYPVYPVRYRRP
jgi:hypothetical protein